MSARQSLYCRQDNSLEKAYHGRPDIADRPGSLEQRLGSEESVKAEADELSFIHRLFALDLSTALVDEHVVDDRCRQPDLTLFEFRRAFRAHNAPLANDVRIPLP